jgi:hypothetical protein
MGAHALGARAYAANAAGLADPDRAGAIAQEIRWQLDGMSPKVRTALQTLPWGRRPIRPARLRAPRVGPTRHHRPRPASWAERGRPEVVTDSPTE